MTGYLTKAFVGVYSPRETTNSEEYKKYFDTYVKKSIPVVKIAFNIFQQMIVNEEVVNKNER